MSKHPERRVSRRTARRVLRGAPVEVSDALAGLLAAAVAPPHDGELDGEQAAVAAFVAGAHHATSPRPRSPSLIRTTLVKLLTVKAAAAAVAVIAVGGVAAVAATSHLSSPSGGSPASASTSSHPASSSAPMTHTTDGRSGTSEAGHEATPSPSLLGLCHAYTAGAGSEHGKALESPAFTALITAAGGKSKVDGYCTTLLNQEAGSAHGANSTSQNTDPGESAPGHQASTDHPTGPPSPHPTGPPTAHATGHPNP